MARIERFEDLKIWQKARSICNDVFALLNGVQNASYSLKNQMERSSGSIMDNIAEGFERNGNKEFIHFLSIAKASCGELRSQLYRLEDFYPETAKKISQLREATIETSKGIQGLISHLKKSDYKGSKFMEDAAEYQKTEPSHFEP
ncbi:four helix bundle protein [Bacteroidota bacterium]